MKKIMCLLFAMVMCIFLIACGSNEDKAANAMELNWKRVHNEHLENEVKAKNEYNNQWVKWTATVFRINDGFVDMANETSNGFPLNSISVYLDNDEIATLRRGQTITIVGKLKLDSFTSIKDAFIVE